VDTTLTQPKLRVASDRPDRERTRQRLERACRDMRGVIRAHGLLVQGHATLQPCVAARWWLENCAAVARAGWHPVRQRATPDPNRGTAPCPRRAADHSVDPSVARRALSGQRALREGRAQSPMGASLG